MDDEPRLAHELHEVRRDGGENRLVGEEAVGQSMHLQRSLGHGLLRIDVDVERASGRDVVEQLDAADLDDAVAGRIGAGGLRVENDLAQHGASSRFWRIVFGGPDAASPTDALSDGTQDAPWATRERPQDTVDLTLG